MKMLKTSLIALAGLLLVSSTSFGQTPTIELGQPVIKEEVRAALQEMLTRPAFHTGAGAPDAAAGFDGDSYMDLATGAFYRRQGGAWARIGDIWLDPTVPPLPAAPPAIE